MIRDVFIFELKRRKCKFHKSYAKTNVNSAYLAGFLGTLECMEQKITEFVTHTAYVGHDYMFTFAYGDNHVFVICSDSDDSKEEILNKLAQIMAKILKDHLAWIEDSNITAEQMSIMTENIDKLILTDFKVALIGFGGVGKTTIYNLFKGADVPMEHIPTMFVNYDKKNEQSINENRENNVLLWDLAGQDRFSPIWPVLLKGANVILLVLDSSLGNVMKSKEAFINLLKKINPDAIVIGIANKQDRAGAMRPELIQKVLGIKTVYGLCGIDSSERFKIRQIIGDAIEEYRYNLGKKSSIMD